MTASQGDYPLSFMTPLTDRILIHIPKIAPDTASPLFILIFTWMEARDAHIAHYVKHYAELFPSSRILVVKCSMWDVVFNERRDSAIKSLQPLASFLSENMTPVNDPHTPTMLLHAFSNGGSIALDHTRAAFRQTTGQPLPPHITIYDSCPGLHNHSRGKAAFASWAAPGSLVRILVAVPLAHLLVCLYWLMYTPWGRVDALARVAAAHNDTSLVPNEIARAYMYSKEDSMIDWRHIEDHAAKARQNGFNIHEMGLFEGSRHVLHARQDGERYWMIVMQTWTQHKLQ